MATMITVLYVLSFFSALAAVSGDAGQTTNSTCPCYVQCYGGTDTTPANERVTCMSGYNCKITPSTAKESDCQCAIPGYQVDCRSACADVKNCPKGTTCMLVRAKYGSEFFNVPYCSSNGKTPCDGYQCDCNESCQLMMTNGDNINYGDAAQVKAYCQDACGSNRCSDGYYCSSADAPGCHIKPCAPAYTCTKYCAHPGTCPSGTTCVYYPPCDETNYCGGVEKCEATTKSYW